MQYKVELKVTLGDQTLTRDFLVEDPYEQTDFQKEICSMADYLSDTRNLEI